MSPGFLCFFFCFLISVPFYVKIPIFPSAHKPLPVLFTRADGVMRTMNTEKLIKTLPVIQNQLDALLDFQVDMTQQHQRRREADCSCDWIMFPPLTLPSSPVCPLSSVLQPNSNELTNGIINTAFMLLFKDSIRLFAAYNEGVINMLGKTNTQESVTVRAAVKQQQQSVSTLRPAVSSYCLSKFN